MIGRKFTRIKTTVAILLTILISAQQVFSDASFIGSWATGTYHIKSSGGNRLFVVIGHAESNEFNDPNLSAVTYGGQIMTKIAEMTQSSGSGNKAYVVVFILNEAGIAAASDSNIIPSWSGAFSYSLTSVFLEGVDQTTPIGAYDTNGATNSATVTTSPLSTNDGDMLIAGTTNTEGGIYTPNNSFTEALESPISNADGCADYKPADGTAETPSVTHSTTINRQAIISFVVQALPDPNKASHPKPAREESGVLPDAGLSWEPPTAYTPDNYNVYFGTDPDVHNNPKYTVDTNSYDPPSDLLYAKMYYWAVDSNNAGTIYPGFEWSFTTFIPVTVGGLIADYIISQPLSTYYASACSYYGALLFAEETKNTVLKNRIIEIYPYSYYTGSQMPPEGDVDKNVYGILPFELYYQTGDANYLTAALFLADEEFANPRPDGLSEYTRFWIDDTYMIGSLQAQAYKSTGDPNYINRAVTQLLGYMGTVENLQQPNGLFHHTLSVPIFWGRGNGWAAAAMTEVLLKLPEDDPNYPTLLEKYQNQMAGLVDCQDSSGMWYQVLDMNTHPDNWLESSCTGMFIFALATGVEKGWLDEEPYKQAALHGWAGLQDYIDEQGRVHEVCTGTWAVPDVQFYFDRPREIGNPHGQAAAIWAAAAILQSSPKADLNHDGKFDSYDLSIMAEYWLSNWAADIFPPQGDDIVNFLDFAELADYWLK